MFKPQPFLYPARFIDGQPVLEMANRAGYFGALSARFELGVPLPQPVFALVSGIARSSVIGAFTF